MPPTELVSDSDVHSINYPLEIETLVIGCDLTDYSFISRMENLKQLYVFTGKNIDSLTFVRGLYKLNQLYIAESQIQALDDLDELMRRQKVVLDGMKGVERLLFGLKAICVNSSNNLNGNMLLETGLSASEIIINHKWICR